MLLPQKNLGIYLMIQFVLIGASLSIFIHMYGFMLYAGTDRGSAELCRSSKI